MIIKIQKKLKSKKGETLPEVLAALLITAIAVAGLFTATAASRNLMEDSTDKMQAVYTEVEDLDAFLSSDGNDAGEDYEKLECQVDYSSDDGSTSTGKYTGYTPKADLGYFSDRLYVYQESTE